MHPLPLSALIHENMAVVATFAFSQAPLRNLVSKKFRGEMRFFDKFVFDIPEQKSQSRTP
jgi:hypothetical protein